MSIHRVQLNLNIDDDREHPMIPSRFHDGGPILDVNRPLWPLVVIPAAILGVPWLVEVVGGWL
jgi:hypothetical protein